MSALICLVLWPVQQEVGQAFWLTFKAFRCNTCTLRIRGDAVAMCVNRVDCLPKRWPRKTAKVKGGSRRPAPLVRKLGDQRVDVMGVLGKGALAMVFSCKVGEDQRNVAVKVERQVRAIFVGECFACRRPDYCGRSCAVKNRFFSFCCVDSYRKSRLTPPRRLDLSRQCCHSLPFLC